MNDVKKFVSQWSGRGYERGEAQPFWLSFLRDVFGISEPEKFINFEVPVPHGFIDALLVDTKTLIEQKSSSVNLDDVEIFRQAKRYNDAQGIFAKICSNCSKPLILRLEIAVRTSTTH